METSIRIIDFLVMPQSSKMPNHLPETVTKPEPERAGQDCWIVQTRNG